MCWQNKAEFVENFNHEPAIALKEEKNFIVFRQIFSGGNISTSKQIWESSIHIW